MGRRSRPNFNSTACRCHSRRRGSPDTLAPHGRLAATASVARADGVWRGAGDAHIEQGGVRYCAAGQATKTWRAADCARASFSIVDEHLRAAPRCSSTNGCTYKVDAGLAAQAPVRGAWQVEMPDIRRRGEFWPELAGSSGSAQWQGRVSGVREGADDDEHAAHVVGHGAVAASAPSSRERISSSMPVAGSARRWPARQRATGRRRARPRGAFMRKPPAAPVPSCDCEVKTWPWCGCRISKPMPRPSSR